MSRSLEVTSRYLNLPVRTGAPMRRVSVASRDIVRSFDIELAEAEPEWWAFLDLADFSGESITISIEGDDSAGALDAVHQSDEIGGSESLYSETRRPQLHFSSRRGWLNDPNGLVHHDGEYHLFYQHNPYGWNWGNMHWGHAVSTDLVHWEELPQALYPDELGTMYSGSAFVDWRDTSGLAQGAGPLLVAAYTAAGNENTQCIATSADRGRTWQKHPGNPVLAGLPRKSRDPKVFWYAPGEKWVMALYLDHVEPHVITDLIDAGIRLTPEVLAVHLKDNTYGLFSSRDLTHWEKMSEVSFTDDAECPEFFEIPVEGRPGETRWILFGANGRYLIGSFDGETFTPAEGPHRLHEGDCFYASQTFTDIPASDGRRILIPWGQTPHWSSEPTGRDPVFEGMPFNQSMGLPVELTLRSTDDGLRIFVSPVRELASLRRGTNRIETQALRPGDDPLSALHGELWEIEADIAVGDARRIVLETRGVPVVYDVETETLSCLESSATVGLVDGRIRLRIFVDRTQIDIFAGDGRVFMPVGIDLTAHAPSLSLRAEGGDARVETLGVHELGSIWA